jgi:hypothetical protein
MKEGMLMQKAAWPLLEVGSLRSDDDDGDKPAVN